MGRRRFNRTGRPRKQKDQKQLVVKSETRAPARAEEDEARVGKPAEANDCLQKKAVIVQVYDGPFSYHFENATQTPLDLYHMNGYPNRKLMLPAWMTISEYHWEGGCQFKHDLVKAGLIRSCIMNYDPETISTSHTCHTGRSRGCNHALESFNSKYSCLTPAQRKVAVSVCATTNCLAITTR